MHRLLHQAFCLAILLLNMAAPAAFATTVRMQTSLGAIDIQLMDAAAPATVSNFLNYVSSAAYVDSFIHRSVPGFIIQGGGYRWNSATNGVASVSASAPVINEFSASRSNLRGTIAMAKLGGDPNSATNQWFFNLGDNSANLDGQNGGFTVFGQVIGNGMQIVDAIAALSIVNAGGPFGDLPLVSVPTGAITAQNLVIISAVTVLDTLESGFNLIGNSLDTTLIVATMFGNLDSPVAGISSNILSVWKWNAVNSRWAFYSPLLSAAGNASYAASKNYELLVTINAGEGYWVNAADPMALPAQGGSNFSWSGSSFTALPSGFNLIANAGSATPSQFNTAVSVTPPGTGVVATDNFASLWAWDAVQVKWYFYSPLLESSGGLPAVKDYADSHSFLHFQDYNKMIDTGVGIWVNKF